MEVMKRLVLLLSCTVALLGGAELSAVHTVYVLSMSKGLDQYLANRLANDHLFQVVTDPKLADAFFTDRVGESLQSKLEEIFPPPVPFFHYFYSAMVPGRIPRGLRGGTALYAWRQELSL